LIAINSWNVLNSLGQLRVEGYKVVEIGPYGILIGSVNGVSFAGSGPPTLGGGAIQSILTLPTDPKSIWIASVNGGVWKTTDGGVNWKSLTDFKVPSLSLSHISFDPTDPTFNTIIAAVSAPSNAAGAAGNLIGVYYTTDGGNTWTVPDRFLFQNSGTFVDKAFKIGQRIVTCIGGWLYATVNNGIYVSDNLGVPGSWSGKGPAGSRCADMVYIQSTSTFVAALSSKCFFFSKALETGIILRV